MILIKVRKVVSWILWELICDFIVLNFSDDVLNQNSTDKDLTDTISDYKQSDLIEYQVDNIPKNANANKEQLAEITKHLDNLQMSSVNIFNTSTPPPSPAEFNLEREAAILKGK